MADLPELFSCTRLSARLTVKYCGSRFLRVRAATVGSADYDSACDRCPIGEHHARTGTLCPDTHTQTPTATPATTTTTTPKETPTMAAKSEYTDDQKREAAKRVILKSEVPEAVGKELGVSGTTVRNWVKRFGLELASEAMDAAAGKEPRAKVAKAATLERAAKSIAEPKPKRAAKVAPEDQAERSTEVKRPSVSGGLESGLDALALGESLMRVLDVPATAVRQHLGVLGSELGGAVRFIADKRARAAVADAAWLLTQAAHG